MGRGGSEEAPVTEGWCWAKTYEGLAGYWPSQSGKWADMVNPMPKYVGSNTLSGNLEWNATGLRPMARRREAQAPIYPFPRPTAGRYRSRKHDAGNSPKLRATGVASHAGNEVGDSKPSGDKSGGPKCDSAWQLTRTQRSGDREEANPRHRTDCTRKATHHPFVGCTAISIERVDWRFGATSRDRAAWAVCEGAWGTGGRIGHAYSFRCKCVRPDGLPPQVSFKSRAHGHRR
jgi:hypothetical protein